MNEQDQKPSVGCIVNFFPTLREKHTNGSPMREAKGQPYPAIITHVWTDETVNLRVFDDCSYSGGAGSAVAAVSSAAKGDPDNAPDEAFWAWPKRV